MPTLEDKVDQFLNQQRIAVVGVSRSGQDAATGILQKFRDNDYEVFPVNPTASEVAGVTCYPSIKEIPNGVDAVMVVTSTQVSPQVIQDCIDAEIKHVWMHRSFGEGSVSDEAVQLAQDKGLDVIAGGCPMMFLEPDIIHKCMRWFLDVSGKLPD